MSFEWRILRTDSIGGDPQTITVNDEIARLQEISIEPNGNCLECSFEGLPSALPIRVRDILTIETRPDNTSSWTALYCGVIVLAGNPRSPRVQPYRMVGLKQRLYETISDRSFKVDSADVATMATQTLNSIQSFLSTLPAGITLTGLDAPTLGFTTGDRYPQFESIGATLDYLAATVGSFIVPSGDTYTYDGDTYSAGDVVPPVKWGVKADGSIFFRRAPITTATAITEGVDSVVVDWPPLSGEGIVSKARLVYAPAGSSDLAALAFTSSLFAGTRFPPFVGAPITFTKYNDFTRDDVHRLIEINNGFDFMDVETVSLTAVEWVGENNTQDGNPTTYAEFTGTLSTNQLNVNGPNVFRGGGNYGWFVTLDVEYTPTQFWEIRFRLDSDDGVELTRSEFYLQSPEVRNTTRYRVVLPIAVPADQAQFSVDNGQFVYGLEARFRATTGSVTGIKVYDLRFWNPSTGNDTTGSYAKGKRLAEAYEILPVEEAATVTMAGIQPSAYELVITPAVGSGTVTMPVERMQYSITSDRGAVTTFLAGEAFSGELNVERAVLEELSSRVVSSAVSLNRNPQ